MNDRRNDSIRLAADIDFSDTLLGEYRFDQSNVDQSNNFTQLIRIDIPFLQGFANPVRQDRASIDAPSFEQARISGHSLTLTQDLGNGTELKSISGYRELDWNDSLDLDGSPLDVAFTQRFTDYAQFSQDLQILGSTDRWNYVAGVYYFADDGETDNPQRFFGLDPDGRVFFDSRYSTKTSAWAAYGQVDYRPLEPLTLSAGMRYTREKKELTRAFGLTQNPTQGSSQRGQRPRTPSPPVRPCSQPLGSSARRSTLICATPRASKVAASMANSASRPQETPTRTSAN